MARVLVVDDEPRLGKLASEMLELDGHEVIRAGGGREAMVHGHRRQPGRQAQTERGVGGQTLEEARCHVVGPRVDVPPPPVGLAVAAEVHERRVEPLPDQRRDEGGVAPRVVAAAVEDDDGGPGRARRVALPVEPDVVASVEEALAVLGLIRSRIDGHAHVRGTLDHRSHFGNSAAKPRPRGSPRAVRGGDPDGSAGGAGRHAPGR